MCCCFKYFSKYENTILEKQKEIDELKREINKLKKELKCVNEELSNREKVSYSNYNINNDIYYRTSEDIEEGYTVFD